MIDIRILSDKFKELFGTEGTAYNAPGRINLIGEHTDYNGGFVFPGAIDKSISAVVKPNGSGKVRLYASDLAKECEFEIEDNEGPDETHFRYVYGVVKEMMGAGVKVSGFDAVYGGDVPLGAGLSSSAALESCFAYAIEEMFGEGKLDRMALAKIGQATEHKYVGVKCGIMDQFASMHGRKGSLMRMDCQKGTYEYYDWRPEGYRLVLIDSCVKHELVGSPYNERRESCERVAQAAGVESLRDCTWEMLEQVKATVPEVDYRRAKFVLGEEERVMAVCKALEKGDYEAVGAQMYLTHEGLSKDYEVSCEELDYLVEQARKHGVSGSRIMGGGFGGCSINLVKERLYDDFVEGVQKDYEKRFGVKCRVIPVVIGDGARKVE